VIVVVVLPSFPVSLLAALSKDDCSGRAPSPIFEPLPATLCGDDCCRRALVSLPLFFLLRFLGVTTTFEPLLALLSGGDCPVLLLAGLSGWLLLPSCALSLYFLPVRSRGLTVVVAHPPVLHALLVSDCCRRAPFPFESLPAALWG
jgi:hypothetical protein